MAKFTPTEKTEITRLPKRGHYDQQTIYSILDEALFCTLAYVRDGGAFQIPTGFCRMDNKVYIHGSVGSFYMRDLRDHPQIISLSTTLMDGIVLARSAFHHSVNYRSVVLFGKPMLVENESELYRALEVFTNKMCPGRWDDIRLPDEGEWKATMVLSIEIEEASAKIRTGGPKDDEPDYDLNVWAGVVPIQTIRTTPQPDEKLKAGIPLPSYLK